MIKRLLFLSASAIIAVTTALGAGHWTLQSKDYTVDTLFHAKIGPGTAQTSLSLSGGSNLKIFYITTDLTNPNVDIRVAQAGNRLTGGAKLSTMSNANTNATTGIEYFAGVNADFFGNSQPIGASVVNSEVYKAPGTSTWINWYMNDSKVPGIEQLQFKGTATCGAASHRVSAINDGRATDYLVIYNEHFAANTGTNAYGTEVVVTCSENISFNGLYECTVDAEPVAGVGSMEIPAGKYVLSGHGTASDFVKSLKKGDKVTLDLNTELAVGGRVTQMAGGQPIILKDGVTLETQNALDHLTALNPRTAVGYSADRKTLVLLVVDGRGKGGSAGVVSKVLADIMRCVGCADAMNFDGGGSSELYTRPFGVRNVPSDGSERTVVNSVWAVSTAPADKEVAEMMFSTPSISLPKYAYFSPTVYAYNQYGLMLSTDYKDFELSCPEELGTIVDGKILFANGSGTYTLTATHNGVKTTMNVTIGSAQPRMRLEKVLVDGYRPYKAEVVANVEGTDMAVDNMAFDWTSDNETVAEVDANGVISGKKTGVTNVTATVDGLSVVLPVEVQKPDRRYMEILGNPDIQWNVTKSSLSKCDVTATDGGLTVDYSISSTRSPYFTVKPAEPIVLYGLPDSIQIIVNPGAGTIKSLTFTAGTKDVRGTAVSVGKELEHNTDNIVRVAVKDFIDADDFASYPVTLTQVRFDLGGSAGEDIHVDISSLSSVHTGVDADAGVEDVILSDSSRHDVIAGPNMVVRGAVIELTVAGRWSLFNTNGAMLNAGDGKYIDTATLIPGTYIVATAAGSARFVVR